MLHACLHAPSKHRTPQHNHGAEKQQTGPEGCKTPRESKVAQEKCLHGEFHRTDRFQHTLEKVRLNETVDSPLIHSL